MTHDQQAVGRRTFLSQLTAIAATSGLALQTMCRREAAEGEPAPALPTVEVGGRRITRLVAGWNPIGGYSYLGPHMDQHMKEYFTIDQTVQFLLDCDKAGINAHQFSQSEKTPEVLRRVRERGSKMNFFGLHAGREGIEQIIRETQPFALVHHGGATDRLFAEGNSQEVHDYVKQVHDQGLLAGVSAHNPACIQQIADEGWEVDFFMCCFYYLTRPHGSATPEPETLQIAYPFYRADPTVMTGVMRQVEQPCFGFKILGAGRLCASQDTVRQAFQFAFENIKPGDGVIVGMYPRHFDEVTADSDYARQFSGTASG